MTTYVVLFDPPRPELVLSELVDSSPLTPEEAADMYRAMATDVLRTIEQSRGELLINYRDESDLPTREADEPASESAVRSLAETALSEPDAARFEIQVGSTRAARAGNTATHLLEKEEADSVALIDPRAPTIQRTDLDGAAMLLRRRETVVGPAPRGHLYYHGMTAPIDFERVYDVPEVTTVVEHALEAGHEVDFASMHPVVATGQDLVTLQAIIEARRAADTTVPAATAEMLADLGVSVGIENGRRIIEQSA